MALSYFIVYNSYLEGIEELTYEERGRLLTACLQYCNGLPPELQGNERILFPSWKAQIDRDRTKYEKKCQKNRENISKRWNSKNNDRIQSYTKYTKDKDKEKKKAKDDNKLSSSSLSDDDDEKISLISDCFSKNIGKNSQVLKKESKKFLDHGLSTDLICRAIEDAAAHDARSWAYVSKILQQCEAQKIYTAEQFEGRVPSSVGGGGKSPGILKGPRTAPKFKK